MVLFCARVRFKSALDTVEYDYLFMNEAISDQALPRQGR